MCVCVCLCMCVLVVGVVMYRDQDSLVGVRDRFHADPVGFLLREKAQQGRSKPHPSHRGMSEGLRDSPPLMAELVLTPHCTLPPSQLCPPRPLL